jgi:hypothetical protein
MTRLEDRQTLAAEISEACAAGARLAPACGLAGIDLRTFQRWRAEDGQVQADGRPEAVRPRPAHALSEAERARIVALANAPRFADMPPARIVPALADEGLYVASEASFHRVLREHGQMRRRGRARPPAAERRPAQHACGHRPGAGLVLGRDLPAQPGAGALVLPVPDPRPLEPQDRRL